MKLKNLIKSISGIKDDIQSDIHNDEFMLTGEILKNELVFKALKQTDEFKECNLGIMDIPNGQPEAKTYLLHEDTVFTGECLIYSIFTTPGMLEPSDLLKPIKDGASITTVVHDDDFIPRKYIVLEFNPEEMQQALVNQLNPVEHLQKKVAEVIGNPDGYQIPLKKCIMVRGDFNIKSAGHKKEFI